MQKSPVSLNFKCPVAWSTMKPHGDGRFCSDCKKMVTDFSKTPIDKLEELLPAAGHEESCGSFFAYQLDQPFKNRKDKIISYCQKVLLRTTSDKFRKPISLLLVMIVLVMTGCHRRLAGAYAKFDNKEYKKQQHPTAQTNDDKK